MPRTPRPPLRGAFAGRLPGVRFASAFFAVLLAVLGGVVAAEILRTVGNALERPSVPAFYEQPAGLAAGDPGSIIKADALLGAPFNARGWRIMYRSTDLNGDPVVATGVLVTPLGPPPPGGRTIVSWGHPTTGSSPDCAPSYGFDPYLGIEGLRLLLDRGYAVVATDYIGMGTDGPDSYLIGATEGNNVLDAARAAQAVLGPDVSDRVVLWGHSQGGQAVLFAAERAPDYAPELSIEAVAVAAPAANLSDLMSAHLDDLSGVTIGSYAFAAFAEIYDEPIESILSPAAIEILPEMNELCLLSNIPELHKIAGPVVGNFMLSDPTTTEPWATLLEENSAGSVAFDAPLFIAQGLDDTLVVPADTEDFAEHEASLGMSVTYHEVPFATHGTIAYFTLPALDRWLTEVGAR
ncbi:lipase family protein [Microbacterium lacus]|uniref:alpha/beta fold hydrolase n=1 Tax=Microbacterium lacus TaxID=415217 RepID=UPI00384B9440